MKNWNLAAEMKISPRLVVSRVCLKVHTFQNDELIEPGVRNPRVDTTGDSRFAVHFGLAPKIGKSRVDWEM